MATPYDMLFGAPTDEERMRATANRLRRREAFATLGAMSGDPVLGEWGRGEMGNLREQAQALRKARQDATRLRPSGVPGYMMRGTKMVPMEDYWERREAEAEAKHARDLELAQVRADTALTRTMEREKRRREEKARIVPEATWRQVSDPINWTQTLQSLVPLVEGSEDISQPNKDVMAQWGRDLGAAGLVNLVEPLYRGAEGRDLRSTIQQVLTRLRAGEFGAALTRFETAEFGKEDPLAAGIEKGDLVNRLKRTVDFLKGQARTKISGREAPGGQDIGWLYENPWEQEAGVSTPEGTVTESKTTIPKGWSVKER